MTLPLAPISLAGNITSAQSDEHDEESSDRSQTELPQSPMGCCDGVSVVGVFVGCGIMTSYLREFNQRFSNIVSRIENNVSSNSTHLTIPTNTLGSTTILVDSPLANKPPVTPIPSYSSKSSLSEYGVFSVPTAYINREGVYR